MDPFRETEHAPILFDIIETLKRERTPTRWMKENEMFERVKAELLNCEPNDANRPRLIRIQIRVFFVTELSRMKAFPEDVENSR
jgi:hypothetical protein